jgi:hypothetical protein
LKTSYLGDGFDPDQHIKDFLEELKYKLSGQGKPNKSGRTSGSGSGNGSSNGGGGSKTDTLDPFQTRTNSSSQDFLANNKTLIILAAIALLIFLYFYSQPEKEPNYYDF